MGFRFSAPKPNRKKAAQVVEFFRYVHLWTVLVPKRAHIGNVTARYAAFICDEIAGRAPAFL
jgi:hypothetical protein